MGVLNHPRSPNGGEAGTPIPQIPPCNGEGIDWTIVHRPDGTTGMKVEAS